MNAMANKQIMQDIFAELSKGNGKPFIGSMAAAFCWTVTGTTRWSGTYRGKQAVIDELFRPLFSGFADRYTNTAQRIKSSGKRPLQWRPVSAERHNARSPAKRRAGNGR